MRWSREHSVNKKVVSAQLIFWAISSHLQPWPSCYIMMSCSFFLDTEAMWGQKDLCPQNGVFSVSAELSYMETKGKRNNSNTEPVFIEIFDT